MAKTRRKAPDIELEVSQRSPAQNNGFAVSRDLNPKLVPTVQLHDLGRKTRKHPHSQIRKLSESLKQWGFVLPIIVDDHRRVVAGWGLVLAARLLNLPEVPVVVLADLSDAHLRSLRLALNRLSDDSSWDAKELSVEFSDIMQLDQTFDLTLTGFEMGEIDVLLDGSNEEEEPPVPDIDPEAPAVTRPGDLWNLGTHRLLCGDAQDSESYERLLDGERAEMVFIDPPYNLPIVGHVSGLGTVRHREFAMASGEMSEAAFVDFLKKVLARLAAFSVDGAIHFVCMDWRGLFALFSAGRAVYDELKNICVWAKTNAGMGSLYRSQHELVAVFKKGKASHINNVDLGRYARNRSNVWTYAGMNTFGPDRHEALAMHPTVKPLALVKDAILDCSNRNGSCSMPLSVQARH